MGGNWIRDMGYGIWAIGQIRLLAAGRPLPATLPKHASTGVHRQMETQHAGSQLPERLLPTHPRRPKVHRSLYKPPAGITTRLRSRKTFVLVARGPAPRGIFRAGRSGWNDSAFNNDRRLAARIGLKSIAHSTNPLRGSPLASGLARPSSW